jgi:hypothetical protein
MLERLGLFLIWFSGFVVCFFLVGMLYYGANPPAGTKILDYLQPVVGIFVPYLVPLIAFWFVQNVLDKRQSLSGGPTFYIAALCSLAFNLFLVAAFAQLKFREYDLDALKDRIDDAGAIATLLAFLVGPAIGFYFGRTADGHQK